MINNAEVRIEGLKALTGSLGEVDAERFISLIIREPFGYTKWQRKLWVEKTVDKINTSAMQCRRRAEDSHTTETAVD